MKQLNPILLFLLLVLGLLAQCTVQKRLYNRGYHIEHKVKFRFGESNETTDSLNQDFFTTNQDTLIENQIALSSREKTDFALDSNVLIVSENINNQQIHTNKTALQHTYWDKRKKLVATGIPALMLGLVAAGALSVATAPGADIGAFLLLGAIGWLAAFVAFIFLVLFIVFLCIPDDSRSYRERNFSENTSNRGKTILVLSLVLMGLVSAAALIFG